jgi:hypothetical protein
MSGFLHFDRCGYVAIETIDLRSLLVVADDEAFSSRAISEHQQDWSKPNGNSFSQCARRNGV